MWNYKSILTRAAGSDVPTTEQKILSFVSQIVPDKGEPVSDEKRKAQSKSSRCSALYSQKGNGLCEWTLIGPSAKMGLCVND